MNNNIQLENEVIGALFKSEQKEIKEAVNLLTVDDFFSSQNRDIITQVIKLISENQVVQSSLFTTDQSFHISECEALIPTNVFLIDNIRTLRQYTAKRKLKTVLDSKWIAINNAINPADDLISMGVEISALGRSLQDTKLKQLTGIEAIFHKNNMSSGFVTFDYNEGGLKPTTFALLLGAKNHGKTTYARQMIYAASMQQRKSFFFCGENSKTAEQLIFARMTGNGLTKISNMGGRDDFAPNQQSTEKYLSNENKYIQFVDNTAYQSNIFEYVISEMETAAGSGTTFFVLDSLTILADASGNKVFTQQKEIVNRLIEFKNKYQVFVMLIVHPKKGKGLESSSGHASIENLADSIYRYVRVTDDDHAIKTQNYISKKSITGDKQEYANVTAAVFIEKIRNGGGRLTTMLEWDEQRAITIEVSPLQKAKEYQDKGFFVKPISRYSSGDLPEHYKN